MVVGSLSGRRLNFAISEAAFFTLFWVVMAGYVVRILFRMMGDAL